MNRTICRLCFKTIGDDFQTVRDIKHTVDKLLLKLNLDISEEIVICDKCAHNLQVYISFKMTCGYKKNMKLPKTITNDFSLGIEDIRHKNSINSIVDSEDQIRCSFCNKETTEPLISINETKENVFMLGMLEEYMELNLKNNEEILTCKTCLESLQSLLKFIMNCLDAGEKKSNNIEVEGDGIDKVDLKRHFSFKSRINYKSDCIGKDKVEVKYEDIQERILLRDESIIKDEDRMDNQQLNIKTEYVDIKSEQSDWNSFPEPPSETSRDDNKKSQFNCDICTFSTSCEMDLGRHLSTHAAPSDLTTYKCEVCLFETKYNWDFNYHIQTHKNSSDTIQTSIYKCEMCKYETHHEGSYTVHKLSHTNCKATVYKCKMCTYETNIKGYFETHSQLNHENYSATKVHKCHICKYKARFKPQLRKHMLRHVDFTENKTFKCEKCSFESDVFNITHMLTHTKSTLTKSVNTATIYRCEECTYETKYSCSFKRHVLGHNAPLVTTTYKCDKCEFKTHRLCSLTQHKWIHVHPSEIKMYKCDFCTHKSRRMCDLKRHMLRHNPSDKTFKCDQCSYEVKHAGYFKRHILIHQKEIQ